MKSAALALAILLTLGGVANAQNGHPISAYPTAATPYTGAECSIGTGVTGATVNICTAPIAVLANSPSVRAALPAASTLTGAEVLSATQSGQAVRLTTAAIAGLATSAVPGGSNTWVQYNSSGSFAGDADLTYTAGSHLHTFGVGGVAGAYGPAVGAGTGQNYLTVTPPSAGLNDPFTLTEVSDSNGMSVQSNEIYTLGFNLNGNGRVNTSDDAGGLFIQTLQSTGAFAKVAFQFATPSNTIYYPIEADYNPTSGVVDASMRCDTCYFLSKDELTTYAAISSSEFLSHVAIYCDSACNTAGGIFSRTYNVLGSSSGQVEFQSLSSAASGTVLVPSVNDTLAVLGTAQTYTAAQTYTNSDLKLLGSSTGATTFTSANAGASNFTITVPAATDTLVDLAGTQTLTNKSIAASEISGAAWSVAQGGTGGASASGTLLDNISGFASTGFLNRTGAGVYSFASATNGLTLGNIAQIGANTVLGNGTGSTANVAAQSMPSCSSASSALIWTSGTGFGCNTISAGFTPAAAEFTYSVASGSSSDVSSFTTATWTQRKLNTTVSNTIIGLSLTTNQLTIPAGTYEVSYGANWYTSGGSGNNLLQSRFRDTTASASFCVSGFMASPPTSYGEGPSGATCILTVAVSHVFEVDTWVTLASTTTSGGFPASTGENEIYVRVTLVKIG